jgi:hypothetical protein
MSTLSTTGSSILGDRMSTFSGLGLITDRALAFGENMDDEGDDVHLIEEVKVENLTTVEDEF